MAERKVYVLGDAERMVMREGSEEAAGAFLKLLEAASVAQPSSSRRANRAR